MITGPEISSGSRLPNTDASSSWHCLCGKHSTVTVQSRTSPGINKPGGVGRIISRTDGFCEVKYCVNGGTEKDIDLCYVACYVEEAAGRGRRERQARTLMNIEQEEVQRKKKAAKKIKMTPKLDGEENVCPKNSTHSFSKKPDKKRPNSNKNKIMTGKIEMGGRECSTALEDISNKPCPDAIRGYTIIQPPQWEQTNKMDLSLDGEQVVAVLEKTRAAAPAPPPHSPPPPPALPPAAVRAAVLAALERGGGEAPVAALAAACIDAGTVSCESELITMLMDLESAGKLMLSDGMVYEI